MTEATQTAGGLTPRFEDGRAMLIAGLSGRYGPTNRADIPALWQKWGPQYFGRTPNQVDRKCYGIGHNMGSDGSFDYIAGVEVSSFDGLPSELTQMRLSPQRYAVFPHAGHVSAISQTWMDIFGSWLPNSGRTPAKAPSFECYDEAFDPAVGVGHVEIWIPVEK
jgi:AraC family transcriptional regulator